MLFPLEALRKNSFRAGLEQDRYRRRVAQSDQVFARGARQEGQGEGERQPPVAEQGAPDRRAKTPARMSGDDLEDGRLGSGGGMDDVRLRGEPVLQKRRCDPRIRVQTQREKRSPADDLREVN